MADAPEGTPEANDLVEPDAEEFEQDELVSDLDEVTDLPEAPKDVDTQDPGDDEEKPAKKTTKKAAKKTASSKKSEEDDS